MEHSKSVANCLSHERVLLYQLDALAGHAQVPFGWPESIHRGGMRYLVIIGSCARVCILVNEHKVDRAVTIPVSADSIN